jgi:hypothetical protein
MAKNIDFSKVVEAVSNNFTNMQKEGSVLYVTDQSNIGGKALFEQWLDAFGEDSPIWRERREHDCDTCRSFVRRFGPVVSLREEDVNELVPGTTDQYTTRKKVVRHTIWEGEELENLVKDTIYEKPVRIMRELMQSLPIEKELVITKQWVESKHLKSYEASRTIILVGSPNGEQNSVIYDEDNANCKVVSEINTVEEKTTKGKIITRNVKEHKKVPFNNGGRIVPGQIYNFVHFRAYLKPEFVQDEGKSAAGGFFEIGDTKDGRENKTKDRHRILQEIFNLPEDGLKTARGLFKDGELWNKEGGEALINGVMKLREEYQSVPEDERTEWVWYKAHFVHKSIAGFKGNAVYDAVVSPVSDIDDRKTRAVEAYPDKAPRITLSAEVIRKLAVSKGIQDYNTRMDPERASHCIADNANEKNIQNAIKFIQENGYQDAFMESDFLTLRDIPASLVEYRNSSKKTITKAAENEGKGALLVAFQESTAEQNEPSTEGVILSSKFKSARKIDINDFKKNVLPDVTRMQVLLQSNHADSIAVLFTSKNRSAKPIYKWGNNCGWVNMNGHSGKSYANASAVKAAVKKMGAYTDAYMSMSLQYFSDDERDKRFGIFDPDLRVIEMTDKFVNVDYICYYSHNFSKRDPKEEDFLRYRSSMSQSGGVLDHDSRCLEPALDKSGEYLAVENIYYPKKENIKDGYIAVLGNYFSGNHTTKDWKAQVTVGDHTKEYEYPYETRKDDWNLIALLHFKDHELIEWIDGDDLKNYRTKIKNDGNRIESKFPTPIELAVPETNEKVCGLQCGKFHDVFLVSVSPNRYLTDKGTLYHMLILRGMRIDKELPTINPQFLNDELYKYRKGVQGMIDRDFYGYKGKPGKKLFCLKPSDTAEQLVGLQVQDGDGNIEIITKVEMKSGAKHVYRLTFGNVKAVKPTAAPGTKSTGKEVVVLDPDKDNLRYYDTRTNTCLDLNKAEYEYLSDFDFFLSKDILEKIENGDLVRVKPGYEVIKKGDYYTARKREEKKK